MHILDGKMIAKQITDDLQKKVSFLKKKPGLAVVLVGNNSASQVYVNMKKIKCEEIGYFSCKMCLEKSVTEEKLLNIIAKLNDDEKIHGILVQLPLPKHINTNKIIAAIRPSKDVDGFHPVNVGKLFTGNNQLIPCTAKGILKLILATKQIIAGKHAVIIGRSNIVGKPTAQLLLQQNATVTICHSFSENLTKYTRMADILVSAVGKPNFVQKDMVKKGAIVIDVGITRLANKKIVGDIDFANIQEIASFITPVPGGVGPMTIACLMENTYEAYCEINQKF